MYVSCIESNPVTRFTAPLNSSHFHPLFSLQDDYETNYDDQDVPGVDETRVEVLDDMMATGEAADVTESKERVTTPYMTKYERARVLGTRALQIR